MTLHGRTESDNDRLSSTLTSHSTFYLRDVRVPRTPTVETRLNGSRQAPFTATRRPSKN